jgi:hypothetical protein
MGKKGKKGSAKTLTRPLLQPSVSQVIRLDKLKEYVPTEEDIFKPGDTWVLRDYQLSKNWCSTHSVFVCHDEMETVPVDGDQYYKLTIVSIHRDKDGETIWILGTWCYHAQDMEKVRLADG